MLSGAANHELRFIWIESDLMLGGEFLSDVDKCAKTDAGGGDEANVISVYDSTYPSAIDVTAVARILKVCKQRVKVNGPKKTAKQAALAHASLQLETGTAGVTKLNDAAGRGKKLVQ